MLYKAIREKAGFAVVDEFGRQGIVSVSVIVHHSIIIEAARLARTRPSVQDLGLARVTFIRAYKSILANKGVGVLYRSQHTEPNATAWTFAQMHAKLDTTRYVGSK